MTDWQTAGNHVSSSIQDHQYQAMELSRIVGQLAAANHQLATAHGTALAHMDALYSELRRDSKNRRRLENEEDEDERRRTEARISKLESIVGERHCACRSRQRCQLRSEKEDKVRSRNEGLVSDLNDSPDSSVGSVTLNRTINVLDKEVEFKDTDLQGKDIDFQGQIPDLQFKDANLQGIEVSVYTNQSLSELGSDFRTSQVTASRLGEASEREIVRDSIRVGHEETANLLQVIARLKNDLIEYQKNNEKLLKESTDQQRTIDQLREDSQKSESRYEEVKCDLNQQKQEVDRLEKELEFLRTERNTASARISGLEEDLRQSLDENERIRSRELEKNCVLKTQLSESMVERQKQVQALENALSEIQRLKETIKTEDKDSIRLETSTCADNVESTNATRDEAAANSSRVSIEEFKRDLTLKREARQRAIAAVSSEMERLRDELEAERAAHSETTRILELLKSERTSPQKQSTLSERGLRPSKADQGTDAKEEIAKRLEAERLTSILKVSDELRNDVRLQIEKVDDLRYQLESEPEQHRYRIRSLGEVTNRSRESLMARERQTNRLKDHLAQILVRLGDRNFQEAREEVEIAAECERQLENVGALKSLYNERLKTVTELRDAATRDLADARDRLEHALKKSENLEEELRKAEEKVDVQDTEITNLESQLGLTKADCRDLQNQMSLINSLFTQMLLGASSADMNLDRLTQLLQENHELISEMAREEGTEAAALPKLLLDLVEQVEGNKEEQKRAETSAEGSCEVERKEEDLQEENIAHNLPKVWRILLELLSCHAANSSTSTVTSTPDPNSCYKSVDTPAGPRLVISVSKTYIRLKELILEKKHLEKEMTRMKQLNTHLESKLSEQETRLSMVSAELSKTWNIVGRMQAQHQQLHTHEKILRYELQQKRKMLQELKQELEYCREKWESARQKNTNTEIEWRSLRREFAARKALVAHDSFNNSGESGFSDERGDDTDEEDDVDDEIIMHGPRRRSRKMSQEGPRTPTPDTESEQPTDTESSEWKACPINLEQRTSTPETDTDLDKVEEGKCDLEESQNNNTALETDAGKLQDLNPLDQALTNVIENLIGINDEEKTEASLDMSEIGEGAVLESDTIDVEAIGEVCSDGEGSGQDLSGESGTGLIEDPTKEKTFSEEECILNEEVTSETGEITCEREDTVVSIFSIGPFPDTNQTGQQLTNPSSERSSAPVFGATDAPNSAPQECDSKMSSKSPTMDVVQECDRISLDSSSSLETVKEFPLAEALPGPSASSTKITKDSEDLATSGRRESRTLSGRTPEEVLSSRADRLRRLEEQADWLMKKMNATSRRGSALSSRLEELHEVYKEPPAPPPMPDVLPSRRLRSSLQESRNQPTETSATTSENTDKDANESPPGSEP